MIKHPVHILDENDHIMPSAFIPFCTMGSNMTTLGKKISKFSVPVCTKFRAKMLHGERCYQLDLQDVQEDVSFRKGEVNALTFLIDYNEDKMVNVPSVKPMMKYMEGRLSRKEVTIYVDTLGRSPHDYSRPDIFASLFIFARMINFRLVIVQVFRLYWMTLGKG